MTITTDGDGTSPVRHLTVDEFAAAAGVHRETVYRNIKARTLPARRRITGITRWVWEIPETALPNHQPETA